MNIILVPRQTGKTSALICHSLSTGYTIVCRDQHTADMIVSKTKKIGFDIPTPITHASFVNGTYRGKNISGFLIDDADDLLKMIAGGILVHTITMTKE